MWFLIIHHRTDRSSLYEIKIIHMHAYAHRYMKAFLKLVMWHSSVSMQSFAVMNNIECNFKGTTSPLTANYYPCTLSEVKCPFTQIAKFNQDWHIQYCIEVFNSKPFIIFSIFGKIEFFTAWTTVSDDYLLTFNVPIDITKSATLSLFTIFIIFPFELFSIIRPFNRLHFKVSDSYTTIYTTIS